MNAYVLLAPGDPVIDGDQILAVDGQPTPSGHFRWNMEAGCGKVWVNDGFYGVKTVSGTMQVRRLLSVAEKTYHQRYGYFPEWKEGDEMLVNNDWVAVRPEDQVFGPVRRLMSKMYKAYTFHDDVPVGDVARVAADY